MRNQLHWPPGVAPSYSRWVRSLFRSKRSSDIIAEIALVLFCSQDIFISSLVRHGEAWGIIREGCSTSVSQCCGSTYPYHVLSLGPRLHRAKVRGTDKQSISNNSRLPDPNQSKFHAFKVCRTVLCRIQKIYHGRKRHLKEEIITVNFWLFMGVSNLLHLLSQK